MKKISKEEKIEIIKNFLFSDENGRNGFYYVQDIPKYDLWIVKIDDNGDLYVDIGSNIRIPWDNCSPYMKGKIWKEVIGHVERVKEPKEEFVMKDYQVTVSMGLNTSSTEGLPTECIDFHGDMVLKIKASDEDLAIFQAQNIVYWLKTITIQDVSIENIDVDEYED